MKNILAVLFICGVLQGVVAQGNDGNDSDFTFGKIGRSIPEKIEEAFKKDYPNAANPVWAKLKMDWTVTFGNGMFRSIATYRTNGERIDTRTHLFVQEAPKPVMEEIVKRYPIFKQKRVILKLEEPGKPEIYNINVSESGRTVSISFDQNGKVIR